MKYRIRHVTEGAPLDLNWENPAWAGAEIAAIKNFLPESSNHHPQTQARLLYDDHGLHGIFSVHDQFVRCQRTDYGSEVWKDACVEFFVEPKPGRGYFNFEFNCGGAFLCNHITNPERTAEGFKAAVRVTADEARVVQVRSTLPRVIDPERTEPTRWMLQFFIPFALLEKFVGAIGNVRGQTWRGNFFKCAEDNSHPHWAAWSPVDEFNFHLPRCFGDLHFEP